MSERVLPAPAKYASCPYDEQILSFYSGQFECVYILLHPFVKPKAIEIERFCPSSWPTKMEIIGGCEPVRWREILELSGLETISDVDIALRTSIGGIKKDISSKVNSERLIALTERMNIIHPSEGDLSPLLENRIFHALKRIGHSWVWLGDEFGTERKLYWIDDLFERDLLSSHGCMFTHDHKLLVTTHWDSHCSFLCSSRKMIDEILSSDNFEGFYCTPNTEVYWGAYEI